MLTGVGGQGVQLAAQVIARAATLEGREVMLFGLYSGMMRGGNSDSTVVVSTEPIEAPPIVSRTWSAIALHPEFWAPMRAKLRAGAVVLVNSTVFGEEGSDAPLDRDRLRVFEVPATELAHDLGNPLGASMVMTGAYAAITGLVGLDAAIEAMAASLPSYRRQHVTANETSLRAGFESVEALAAPAWEPVGT